MPIPDPGNLHGNLADTGLNLALRKVTVTDNPAASLVISNIAVLR